LTIVPWQHWFSALSHFTSQRWFSGQWIMEFWQV